MIIIFTEPRAIQDNKRFCHCDILYWEYTPEHKINNATTTRNKNLVVKVY